MSDESKKLHSRIRTFAADLDAQRKNKSDKKVNAESAVEEKEVKDTGILMPEPRREHADISFPVSNEQKIKLVKKEVPKPQDNPKEVSGSKIPSFHELQKSIKLVENNHPNNTTVSSKEDSIKTTAMDIGDDAKVITDTKSKDFSFFTEVLISVKTWFKTFASNHKKKTVPKYSVTETNHRKGVIQKATSKTGTIFSSDSDTIKEHIRRRRQIDKDNEKVEEHELETSWSPFTETGYALLEAPDETPDVTTNVVIAVSYTHLTLPTICSV